MLPAASLYSVGYFSQDDPCRVAFWNEILIRVFSDLGTSKDTKRHFDLFHEYLQMP